MSELHETTRAILTWAKRAAVAARRESLSIPDLLCGVYALREDAAVAATLSARSPSRPGSWAQPIVMAWQAASLVEETERKFPLDDQVRALVHRLHLEDPTLPPARLVSELVTQGRAFDESPAPSAAPPGAPARSAVLDRLERAREATDRIIAALDERVFGQEQAIRALGEAYYRAELGPAGRGPRGVLTFLGPPGVGKTWLAECFAEELGRAEGGNRNAFQRFDMGSFGGPQNFEQLFGAEQFYKGSRPGTLTGFVHDSPACVVLLDEIEKAHPTTIQALLAVLDRGEATDKALDKPVDFRSVWFVLTTNLGQHLFAGPNRAGVLAAGGTSPDLVLDILTARPSLAAGGSPSSPGLPPEMVSRLAKGGVVALGSLETRHYLRIVHHSCRIQGDPSPPLHLRLSDDAAFLFLLSQLPRIDARRVAARAEAWATELVRTAHLACLEELTQANPEHLTVRVDTGPAAAQYLDEKVHARRLRMLVVDDGDAVRELLSAELASHGIDVVRAASRVETLATAQRIRPDLVLLDLSIDESPTSARVSSAEEVLEALRTAQPWLPVILFSENVDGRHAFEAVVSRVLSRGGARAFIALRRDHTDPLTAEDFLARVRQSVDDVRLERVLREQVRANKALRLVLETSWDAERGDAVVSITGLAEQVVIAAADREATIRFAGIPTERLDDVVGLERARRRLGQVLGWLANPASLEAFGARPPRGFLLAGPPGTGKTMLARALAGEAGLPFLAVSAGELQSKWVGESEARIRELFERAQSYAPAIVFIDEIDAIAGRRGESSEHSHSVLNQLLASMDGFQASDQSVFVLAATNHAEGLDPAIRRPGRFDEVIPVERPNAGARRIFFERRLTRMRIDGEHDLERLVRATSGMTPAELDRIAREAAYAASTDGRSSLVGEDLLAAARLVRFGAEREDMPIRPDELRVTAWHEAGHAVAHLVLLPEEPVELLTIVPNERGALGFLAVQHDESRHDLTVERLRRQLAILLAGREAERVLGGDAAVTTGAQSDLEQATKLAAAAVGTWGFDEAFGPVSLAALGSAPGVSPRLQRLVRRWLDEATARARALLAEHRGLHQDLVGALLERESLDASALREIVAKAAPR